MLTVKNITQFFLKATILYFAFVALGFFYLRDGYSDYFLKFGNCLDTPFGWAGAVVQFEKNTKKDAYEHDLRGVIMNKSVVDFYRKQAAEGKITEANVPAADFRFNSFRQGYLPTILVLIFILATPFSKIRNLIKAVIFGLIFIHLFLWFKFSIWIFYLGNQLPHLEILVTGSPLWKGVLGYGFRVFIEDVPARIIVPILIWFLVSFSREDLNALKKSF